MRATSLTLIQRYRLELGHDDVRLERFWDHPDNQREFYDIDCKVQIQIQIFLVSAYETS